MKIIESNIKFKSSLSNRATTEYIALHHAEASKCSVYDIDSWHKSNGWSGIGYHFFVRKDGSIYRGRPINKMGAHVSGMNNRSIGICAEGSYMKETMPYVQKKAICELLVYLKDNFYPNAKIVGHREIGDSNCPGTNYPLDEIKKNYRAIANASKTSEPENWAEEFLDRLYKKGIIANKGIWSNYNGYVKKCHAAALIDKITGGTWTSSESDSSIHWAQPNIISLVGKGFIANKDSWVGSLETNISKAVLLALLAKIYAKDIAKNTTGLKRYEDTKNDHYGRNYLNYLCDKGVIKTPTAWTDFDNPVTSGNFMALVCKIFRY